MTGERPCAKVLPIRVGRRDCAKWLWAVKTRDAFEVGMGHFLDFFDQIKALDGPFVVATLIRVKGSAFRRVGAQMAFSRGERVGILSPGCLDADLALRVEQVLETRQIQKVVFKGDHGVTPLLGLSSTCAREIEVLLEPMGKALPPWMHVCAQSLAKRKPVVLATVIEGPLLGDRFVMDEGGHGLLPRDAELHRALHHAHARVWAQRNAEEISLSGQWGGAHPFVGISRAAIRALGVWGERLGALSGANG